MPGERSLSTNEQEHLRLQNALRESELLREIAALLASSLDSTRILDILMKRTTEVCAVERCAVWLREEAEGQLLPASYYLSTEYLKPKNIEKGDALWHERYKSAIPLDAPIIATLLQEGGIIALENMHMEPSLRIIAEQFLVHSALLVALIRDGQLVGMMSLDNPGRYQTFSKEQKQFAHAIGQQAAIAIGNAQLYQQAQKERRRAELLIERVQSIYQVANAVNAGVELTAILQMASQHLIHALSADGGMIALLRDGLLSVVPETLSPTVPANTLLNPTLAQLPHCHDAARSGTPRFVKEEQVKGVEKQWHQQLGFHNVIIVPLLLGNTAIQSERDGKRISASRCIGFAFVNYQQSTYYPTKGQYAFAQDVATQCALAIEKERILAETRRAAMLANDNANKLSAVFNAMAEGITVLDLDGQVLISNNTASHFLGVPLYAKEHLSTFLKNYPTYTVNGQRMAERDFPLTRALKGEPIRGERFVTKRADKSERTLEVSVAPLLDNDGKKIGIVSAFRDVTEQIRIDRRIRRALDTMLHAVEMVASLKDSRDILRTVLAMTVTTLNCEHGLVQLYDAERQIFTPLLSIGLPIEKEKQWLDIQTDTVEQEHFEAFRLELLGGHATLMRADQCPNMPTLFSNSMVLAAPITRNHDLLGVMIFHRKPALLTDIAQIDAGNISFSRREFTVWDITIVESIAQFAGMALEEVRWKREATTARQNEATMRESNELKDQFLDITAHEFRTPLTVILAHTQMIARAIKRYAEPTLQDKLQEHMSAIEDQARQLTNIVNMFLEVARLNTGQIILDLEDVDLAEIARQSVLAQSATTTEHSITCFIAPDNRPYRIQGDAPRLLQVFTNLLQNAIKYSPFGGSITVSLHHCITHEGKTFIEVRVQDQGIGISPDIQSHLFERFYRAPVVEGGKTKGLGLGLYIVAEFLRLHNGTIHVESSGEVGKGSCFVFRLPVVESDVIQSERAS